MIITLNIYTIQLLATANDKRYIDLLIYISPFFYFSYIIHKFHI